MTGWTNDELGIMTTFAARPGAGSFGHEFVTTPGLIAVMDGVVAGVLAAILQYRLVVRPRGLEPSFPERQPVSSATNR